MCVYDLFGIYVYIYVCIYIYVYVYIYVYNFFFFLNIKSKIICLIIIGGQLDEIVFFLVAFGIAINLIFLLFIFVLIVYAVLKINTTT